MRYFDNTYSITPFTLKKHFIYEFIKLLNEILSLPDQETILENTCYLAFLGEIFNINLNEMCKDAIDLEKKNLLKDIISLMCAYDDKKWIPNTTSITYYNHKKRLIDSIRGKKLFLNDLLVSIYLLLNYHNFYFRYFFDFRERIL